MGGNFTRLVEVLDMMMMIVSWRLRNMKLGFRVGGLWESVIYSKQFHQFAYCLLLEIKHFAATCVRKESNLIGS